MRAVRACPAVVLLLCLPTLCCTPDGTPGGESASGHIELVDADGRTVRLDSPARRVVSLVPSATQTLDALGMRDVLVARTDFDTTAWTRALPSVGGGLHPRLEAIVAVHPDLVIRFGGSQDARTPVRLDEMGIEHVSIRPDRVEDVLTTIRTLGRLTGSESCADSLIASLQEELDAIREEASGRPSPRVAYVLGGSPPWVAGPGTYIDEIIRLAGGVNAFDDLGSLYAAVSPEQFLAREIDVILTPDGSAMEDRLVGNASVTVTSDALEMPGPALGRAAREVAAILQAARER
jgi:iron complex transport system substrate-binding protein